MQSLDVISINLWQILISLCNLLILFFILKKFLYKPVMRITEERGKSLREQYSAAENARRLSEESRAEWEEKRRGAKEEARQIVADASKRAECISDGIVLEAKKNAADIIKKAKSEADAEYQKARSEIKKEIIDVSSALTEKILERELSENDRRSFIDKAISEMGDENE